MAEKDGNKPKEKKGKGWHIENGALIIDELDYTKEGNKDNQAFPVKNES